MRRNLIVIGLGLIVSAILFWTFGWIGTLLLNMPGFAFATVIEGHAVSKFGPYMLFGTFIFYTALFWGVQQLWRSLHARVKR